MEDKCEADAVGTAEYRRLKPSPDYFSASDRNRTGLVDGRSLIRC
jgi:hypothetical protein